MLLIKPASRARYDLDKFVYRDRCSVVHHGAKPNPLTTPISLQKIILRQKTRNDENRLAFQPDFQAHGTCSGGRYDCGNQDSDRDGKRR
ncbi:MAG: hypothetical protein E6856_14375 [Klebsiella michiganensis]|nr:hypothetical protein [Klebsiella michiganensis]MDU1616708.1 hypothetical protein [Klebsiella michiganensis]